MINPRKRIARRVKRLSVKLAVREINGQPVTETFILDISSLGARLETSTPLAPRCPVRILASLPGINQEMELSGQVMWMRPRLEAPGRFQMGLRFYVPQWDLDRLLKEIMR